MSTNVKDKYIRNMLKAGFSNKETANYHNVTRYYVNMVAAGFSNKEIDNYTNKR